MSQGRGVRGLILIAGGALALAACGQQARTQIRIVGSSTVFPYTTAVAESFKRANPDFKAPIVESTGTGGGIKLFCSGVGSQYPDMVNASRRIKASELKDCAENGVTEVMEVQVGVDGLVIAQSKRGTPLPLTTRDIYAALAAEPFGRPQTARTWRDVNPALPPIRIEVIGPPPTSGTRDAFNELFMAVGCDAEPAMKALKKSDPDRHKQVCEKVREDGPYVEGGENDNLIVQKIGANPNAVGVFGYSYFEQNLDSLRDVPVNGVMASYDSIATARYPGARPLFVYVKLQHVRVVRGMREFLAEFARDSTWGPRGYLIRRGLVAAPDAVRADNADRVATLRPIRADEL